MGIHGERLREALRESGKTHQQLADAIGVSRVTITNWARGEGPEIFGLLASAAQTLGVSTDYLLGTDEEQSPGSAPITTRITTRPPAWEARRSIVLEIEVRVRGHEEEATEKE